MKKINQTILSFAVLATTLLPITNCAAIFKGTSEDVDFNSQPTGAEVYINGMLSGTTPLRIKLESKNTYYIEFRKAGLPSKTYRIGNNIGAGWIVLDILAGLVPVVIDAATNSWYELDNKNIYMILEPVRP
jgi:hypothetical protein